MVVDAKASVDVRDDYLSDGDDDDVDSLAGIKRMEKPARTKLNEGWQVQSWLHTLVML